MFLKLRVYQQISKRALIATRILCHSRSLIMHQAFSFSEEAANQKRIERDQEEMQMEKEDNVRVMKNDIDYRTPKEQDMQKE